MSSLLFSIPSDDDETGDKVILSNLTRVIITRPQTTLITRRSAATLIIATTATAFASNTMIDSAEAATTIIDPLTDLSFGTASWNDPAESYASSSQQQSPSSAATTAITTTSRPIPLNARIVPPSFATYLSRFLLHYDTNAEKWWIAQTDLYSLLPVNEAKKKQSQTFASYAYSIQRGLYTYISGKDGNNIQSYAMVRTQYAALLVALLDRYDNDKKTNNAKRDIGLLFAILPGVYQPVDQLKLLLLSDNSKTTTAAILTTKQQQLRTSRGVMTNENAIYDFTSNYQQDFTLLLPQKYQVQYDPKVQYYTITPPINLFEIPINNEGDITSASSTSSTTTNDYAISTTFGPLSYRPLSRERKLSLDIYALLGISGGLGCASTHTLVIPLDVVKTRIQTNSCNNAAAVVTTTTTNNGLVQQQSSSSSLPNNNNMINDILSIITNEGWSSLFLGAQATIVGYLWYGCSVYPSYTYLKHYIAEEILSSPAYALAHANDVALLAGALASIIASIGLTPTEACRIRAVAQPNIYRNLGLIGTMRIIATEDTTLGWKNLYTGLPSLMTRQVIFGSIKFITFERMSDAIYTQYPELRIQTYTALGVSLVAGGISGVLSSIVSQPADSVLTFVAKRTSSGSSTSTNNRGLGILDGTKLMVQEEGLGSLFRGLGSRSVWAGCIIAGQFLLYDVFRAYFGITGEDLTQVFELVLPKTI
jgi:solute carrier family 25 phosphate transporter 3